MLVSMLCLHVLRWWLHLPRLSLGGCLRQVSPYLLFWSDASDVDCDYSRVTRVSSTTSDSSNEPAVFAHFWLRRGRMVLRPRLSCLSSRFTHVGSL